MKKQVFHLTTKFKVNHFYKLVILCLLAFLFSCQSQTNEKVPATQTDGWEIASLKSVGIDSAKIHRLTKRIEEGRYRGLRSLVIVKDGYLVHEAYFNGYEQDDIHRLYSISKSVTSLLIGIAIDKGLIKSTDEPILKLLPKYSDKIVDQRIHKITLKHILTQSPGLEWDENSFPYNSSSNSHLLMERSKDWLEFVLSRPLKYEPGTRWIYSTGNTHLLSAVIKEHTGLYADEFAEKYLFKPLGISRYDWNKDPNGYPCTGGSNGGLRLKTRDLAKIGQLVLNNGKWQGQQIISERWIKESTDIHMSAGRISKYGYQWWRDKYKINGVLFTSIAGYGYGGQALHIFPEHKLLIAYTSWGRAQSADTLPALLRILHAVVPD